MTHRDVLEGGTVRHVPACLAIFRIGDDGRLAYVRRIEVDAGNEVMFWAGMVDGIPG
jgi:hypothetical protein